MNETIKSQLNHASVRSYRQKPISDEIVSTLFDVVAKSANSSGMQASSIIKVTDQVLKDMISIICKQDYIASAPLLLIFVADQKRNYEIVAEKAGNSDHLKGMDYFFSAFTDAVIAAQNLVVAAESLGLGTVYLGSVLNDVPEIISLLDLPPLTFPVVGLAVGYPDSENSLKPRLDMHLRVFDNKYHVYDSYLNKVKAYDEIMESYYKERSQNSKTVSFSDTLVSSVNTLRPKRVSMLKYIKGQGFKVNLD